PGRRTLSRTGSSSVHPPLEKTTEPGAPRPPPWRRSRCSPCSPRQRCADDLPVVAREHTPVCERRVAPQHLPVEPEVGWLQHLPAADLFVTLLAEPGDDQLPRLTEDEEPLAVLHQERRRRRYLLHLLVRKRLQGLPQPLA